MHSESYWYLMDHHYTHSFVYLFLFPPAYLSYYRPETTFFFLFRYEFLSLAPGVDVCLRQIESCTHVEFPLHYRYRYRYTALLSDRHVRQT